MGDKYTSTTNLRKKEEGRGGGGVIIKRGVMSSEYRVS